MHLNVLLTGRLKGMGHEAKCEMMARRSSSRDPGNYVYSEPVIIHAPGNLPEGAYMLHFENVSTPVLHKGVLWLTSAPPPADAEASKPATGGPVLLARRLIRDRRGRK